MTSKLKCPICGGELVNIIGLPGCTKCNFLGNEYTQKALLRTQKQLKIARKALEELIAYYDHYDSFDGEISWDGVALIMRNDAHQALEQIEHKEQK